MQVEFDADGKAIGVTSEGETAKCKKVVCDPSYLPEKVPSRSVEFFLIGNQMFLQFTFCFYITSFSEKWRNWQVKKVGKVARAICIMSHPIPDTNDSHSAQVILPQKQLGRKSDM